MGRQKPIENVAVTGTNLHPETAQLYSNSTVPRESYAHLRRISCHCDPPIQIGIKVIRKWELMNPGLRTEASRDGKNVDRAFARSYVST